MPAFLKEISSYPTIGQSSRFSGNLDGLTSQDSEFGSTVGGQP
jgi:hypothetical protein